MAAPSAYTARDIVEDFLRYKLLSSGLRPGSVPLRLRPPGAQRRHDAAAERHMTSHRGVAPQDTQQAPPRLQVVLRCAGDALEHRYHGDLAAHASVLLLCDGSEAERRRGLTAVREELFRDGVNWGRIVAMMELGGALCTQVIQRGGAWEVDDITGWMVESLDSELLQGWIEDNGGWDAFVELYSESRPPAQSSPWSLRTMFGLVVLGAAGLTLGVLFTQR